MSPDCCMIFGMNSVRAQGQNVSDTERRANAEHVISAIYNMLGDEYHSDLSKIFT